MDSAGRSAVIYALCKRGRWHNAHWLHSFINSASGKSGLPHSFPILCVVRGRDTVPAASEKLKNQ